MNILDSLQARFAQYKALAEKALAQLNDEQFLMREPEGQNSISMIIRHMHGNMLSRFTNFLTEDGEKAWRQRDAEFEESTQSRDELMNAWEAGWRCLFDALKPMQDAQLNDTVLIRGEGMTALDAILRQLAHYSYHVGQMVTLCKQHAAGWTSLSIPKGESQKFTATMRAGQRPATGG